MAIASSLVALACFGAYCCVGRCGGVVPGSRVGPGGYRGGYRGGYQSAPAAEEHEALAEALNEGEGEEKEEEEEEEAPTLSGSLRGQGHRPLEVRNGANKQREEPEASGGVDDHIYII